MIFDYYVVGNNNLNMTPNSSKIIKSNTIKKNL